MCSCLAASQLVTCQLLNLQCCHTDFGHRGSGGRCDGVEVNVAGAGRKQRHMDRWWSRMCTPCMSLFMNIIEYIIPDFCTAVKKVVLCKFQGRFNS